MGEALMHGSRDLDPPRILTWVLFVFGAGASVFAMALASEGDDYAQAAVMSAACLWADAFWIAMGRKMLGSLAVHFSPLFLVQGSLKKK